MRIKRQFTECKMFAVHLAGNNDPESYIHYKKSANNPI